jgi:hypothetical protein
MDQVGCNKDDVLITFVNCAILDFDGIDDNVTFKNNYSLNSGSFRESWIKSNETNGNKQTIISKRLGTSTADGYDLKLAILFLLTGITAPLLHLHTLLIQIDGITL